MQLLCKAKLSTHKCYKYGGVEKVIFIPFVIKKSYKICMLQAGYNKIVLLVKQEKKIIIIFRVYIEQVV